MTKEKAYEIIKRDLISIREICHFLNYKRAIIIDDEDIKSAIKWYFKMIKKGDFSHPIYRDIRTYSLYEALMTYSPELAL